MADYKLKDVPVVDIQVYDATTKKGVNAFADLLKSLQGEAERRQTAARILSAGHMRTHVGLRLAVTIGNLIHRDGKFNRWDLLLRKYPAVVNELLAGTIKHVLYGKDAYDKKSVGGFSQNEISDIANFIIRLRRK